MTTAFDIALAEGDLAGLRAAVAATQEEAFARKVAELVAIREELIALVDDRFELDADLEAVTAEIRAKRDAMRDAEAAANLATRKMGLLKNRIRAHRAQVLALEERETELRTEIRRSIEVEAAPVVRSLIGRRF